MTRDSYTDVVVVHRYLDEIVTFIEGIVQKESVAIVLACQVFKEHKKREVAQAFTSESDRAQWLRLKARDLAMEHLQHQQHETQKAKAI